VAASGKDTDGPNNPTRKRIQSTAVVPSLHAECQQSTHHPPRARTHTNKWVKVRQSSKAEVTTNLGGDPVHHVPVKHETLLPRELNRDLVQLLPPPSREPSPGNARRRRSASSIDTSSAKRRARPRHPGIVRGRRGNRNDSCGCTAQDRGGAAAATAALGDAWLSAVTVGRGCETLGWSCAVAEHADIERWFGERVLLREQRHLLYANICIFLND
jgi:hypothetical protein